MTRFLLRQNATKCLAEEKEMRYFDDKYVVPRSKTNEM